MVQNSLVTAVVSAVLASSLFLSGCTAYKATRIETVPEEAYIVVDGAGMHQGNITFDVPEYGFPGSRQLRFKVEGYKQTRLEIQNEYDVGRGVLVTGTCLALSGLLFFTGGFVNYVNDQENLDSAIANQNRINKNIADSLGAPSMGSPGFSAIGALLNIGGVIYLIQAAWMGATQFKYKDVYRFELYDDGEGNIIAEETN